MKCSPQFLLQIKVCLAGLLIALHMPARSNTALDAESGSTGDAYAISLEQLSPYGKWRLRGVDGRNVVGFGVRDDQHINKLELDLTYQSSPALIQELSHLNVLLNGDVVASLPSTQTDSDEQVQAQVALPLTHLQPYNFLEVQAVSHYTMDCEDPLHQSLWVDIDKRSQLVFHAEQKVLPNDLNVLPSPFFDSRDIRPVELPFVLGQPSDIRLEAAGVVASWLGALASHRGSRFSVLSDAVPDKGNAVIVLGPDDTIPGVDLPSVTGPTVAMRSNPNDPNGKLLILSGRNDNEIRTAAVSLALGGSALSGSTAIVDAIVVQPRKPYDAPNWLAVDRPVALGELLPEHEFTVEGFDPPSINLGLRLPPSLSDWRTQDVALDLRYRHSAFVADQGMLDVMINQQLVRRIDLASQDEAVRRTLAQDGSSTQRKVLIPLSMLGSQAGLQFQFLYPPPEQTECRGAMLDVHHSSIDPDSTIDLSDLPHHMAMPDLAAFSTAGFPFTRMADLSDTVIMLSPAAAEHEFAAFLSIMGKMGIETGYPAIGVTVSRDDAAFNGKDILMLETAPYTGLLKQWSAYIPRTNIRHNDASGGDGFATWWTSASDWLARIGSADRRGPVVAPAGGAYFAGFESPVTADRSVVVIAGTDGASLRDAIDLMMFNEEQRIALQGSVATVQGDRIRSLSNSTTYHIGDLGPVRSSFWFLSHYPLILYVMSVLAAILIAIVFYLSLRGRAIRRLSIEPSSSQSTRKEQR